MKRLILSQTGENMKRLILFSRSQVKELAIFLSELVKEGMAFDIENHDDGWGVKITGF